MAIFSADVGLLGASLRGMLPRAYFCFMTSLVPVPGTVDFMRPSAVRANSIFEDSFM